MSSFKKKYWWLFPIWRGLLYTLAMAVLWALPIVILGAIGGGISYFYESSPPPTEDGMDIPAWLFFLAITIFFGSICFLFGAIPGLFASIFAPASEPINPFKSKFLRKVGSQSFWFLLLSMGFFYINAVVLDSAINQQPSIHYLPLYEPYFVIFWLVGTLLGYGYGVYRAVNNALKASKQAAKID